MNWRDDIRVRQLRAVTRQLRELARHLPGFRVPVDHPLQRQARLLWFDLALDYPCEVMDEEIRNHILH